MAVAQTTRHITRQPRPAGSERVDALIHQLVSLVLAPDWAPDTAAARIAARAHGDPRLLRLARVRLWRAGTHPRSRVTTRAQATLDLAIDREAMACQS